jgi:agmatine deiminase
MSVRAPFTPGSPAAQGYRMPAEFEPHVATWLSWPHKEASWPGKLDRIPPLFAAMVRALVPGELVNVLVNQSAPPESVRALLQQAGVLSERVRLHEVATDDAWIRDSGPTFVTRSGDPKTDTAIINWGYNAWGGKYPPWDNDDVIPPRVAGILQLPLFTPGMILEGGSIDVNGQGTLLTTEACLLNPNRNPRLAAEIEQNLRDYLGVRNILCRRGILGDDKLVTSRRPDPSESDDGRHCSRSGSAGCDFEGIANQLLPTAGDAGSGRRLRS